LGPLEGLEGDEDDFYFGCLLYPISWCFFFFSFLAGEIV
jgi:hypothetical protein